MNYKIMKYVFPMLIVAFVIGCSDLNDDLTTPGHLNIHSDGIASTDSPNFHAAKLADSNWDIESCQQCHASDYSGGTVEVSCNGCHSNPGGPEACNTCHGSFGDVTRIAPPTDLHNNVATTHKGVGAHSSHIYDIDIAAPISCYTCHPNQTFPGQNYISSHADGLPAEVSIPGYNTSTYTCSNTVCHGNFTFPKANSTNQWAYTAETITGNNATPLWTKVDGTQAACGTCHGLPPTGHIAADLNLCVDCHADVINEAGEIIAPLLHADGNVQLVSENVLSNPECNHCHSNESTQPFEALGGVTDRDHFRVGLHNEHLFENTLGSEISCESCHNVPATFSAAGHFDSTYGSEVEVWEQQDISLTSFSYETEIYKCNNTYCHGNFEYSKADSDYPWAYEADVITGNSVDLTWLQDGDEQVACGTCHGLAPTGHVEAALSECKDCHDTVVNELGEIISSEKHINGVINVFGN